MHDFRERPGRGLAPRQQFFDATVPIGFSGDNPRFFGSGFLVANVGYMNPFVDAVSAADVFLVTAAHVVTDLLFADDDLCIRVPRYNEAAAIVTLPRLESWVRSATGADVSVVRLPNLKHDYRPGGWGFPVIAADQFFVSPWIGSEFNLGDHLRSSRPLVRRRSSTDDHAFWHDGNRAA